MLVFVPTSVAEIVSFGEGMAAAEGHSLNLPGVVLEGISDTRTFCDGHLRIQERTAKDKDYLGVAQITEIKKAPYFSAALIVEREMFKDIREVLIRGVGKLQVRLEDAKYITPAELAQTGATVTLVAASVSGIYATVKPGAGG
jgi:hypothetical protein